MKWSSLLRLINFWLPLWGAGIRVTHISKDLREINVELKHRPWTLNYVRTQYGGSIFSMTDPFFMLMLIENLGRDYIVWDQSASIRFKKPGRTKLKCAFRLSEEQLNEIRSEVDLQGKIVKPFQIEVMDMQGEVVASIEKNIHIRKHPKAIKGTSEAR